MHWYASTPALMGPLLSPRTINRLWKLSQWKRTTTTTTTTVLQYYNNSNSNNDISSSSSNNNNNSSNTATISRPA